MASKEKKNHETENSSAQARPRVWDVRRPREAGTEIGATIDSNATGAETLSPPTTHAAAPAVVEQDDAPPSGAVDVALLTNFTHQVINPLNAVVGTLDNLIDGTIRPAERRQQRLKAVRAQLAGAIELVRNLAYLSQLSTEQGREGLRTRSSDVSIPLMAIEAALYIQEIAQQRGVEVHVSGRAKQHMIKGHSALIRQVFLNILENGVKYSDENSVVTVNRHWSSRTKKLVCEIVSYGPGFMPSEKEKIFELGFRGADARNIKASGSGLGLYICRQIVNIHDGEIDAEYSPRTRKTVFRVKFNNAWFDGAATERMRTHGDTRP